VSLNRLTRACALLGLAVTAACTNGKLVERESDRYDLAHLAEALEGPEADAGLVLGVFPLAPNAVVDGDTIKVAGLDASLRLLALDTEETWKSQKDYKLYERHGFEKYLQLKQDASSGLFKGATPLGMDAKYYADDFFRGVTHVRLERDHPKEIRGAYGRFLTYVFVERDGKWVNYNVECVRAGMSPYFAKYGYSRRFHDEFLEAQEEARANEVGIWDPSREHYRDYDLRLRWWNGRGAFIEAFEKQSKGRADHVVLTHWDSLDQLARAEGKEVWLLASIGSVRRAQGNAPTRVILSRRMFSGFPLVFFDERVFERSGIAEIGSEFIVVRGTVSSYTFKGKRRKSGSKQLQIVVRNPDQIVAWSAGLKHPGRSLEGKSLPPATAVLGGIEGGVELGRPSERDDVSERPVLPADDDTTPDDTTPDTDVIPEPPTADDAAPGDTILPPPPPPPPSPDSHALVSPLFHDRPMH
jgi:endonuclease YncB( thermonuclease family)